MLKRFYADNYKCLVNFEFSPGPIQLLLGQNGSGKSTVRNVLSALQRLIIDGDLAINAFPTSSLTRWLSRPRQSFQLEIASENAIYKYELTLEHDRERNLCKIEKEEVTYNSKPLYLFENGEVHLFNDGFKQGVKFGSDWSRSFLAVIDERPDNTKLTWFKRWMRNLYSLQINPTPMTGRSESEDSRPVTDVLNFASWFRNISQERPGKLMDLYRSLGEVIEEFNSLPFSKYGGNVRMLQMETKTPGSRELNEFAFDELSDGQRQLIALYTLLHFVVKPGVTFFLDEPDNFVALREIQPWLVSMKEECEENGAQIILASHHPEIINYLAPESALNVVREAGAHTRVEPFSNEYADAIDPAEVVARGWENG